MRIYFQGVDITEQVNYRSCIVRDTSGDRCDSLDIEFENAADWYRWAPKEDDKIIVEHDGYNSGIMYVNRILPEDGKYRIIATALPCNARQKRYASYAGKTVREIMRLCAVHSGMDYAIYGINGDTVIPYIEQDNEGDAAFLSRLMLLEGASLKCVNGKYTAIGMEYAQSRDAALSMELASNQSGTSYKRDGAAVKSLTVRSPYASATATDAIVGEDHSTKAVILPVADNGQAARWTRNKLRRINQQSECVKLETAYSPRFTALARVDVTGATDMVGEWIIESVEHDFHELKSKVTMRRVIVSVV